MAGMHPLHPPRPPRPSHHLHQVHVCDVPTLRMRCYACAMRTTMHLIARVPWWQWDVDELDSLVREIEAGDATLPARRLLAIALARKGDVPGAEAQARLYLLWMALLTVPGAAAHKRGSYT